MASSHLPVSYTHLRAHETDSYLVCRLLLEKKEDLEHIKFDKRFHLESLALRSSEWMQQDIFTNYQSETELMRYIFRLAEKDFSLVDGMMPLGSCTMKLNSAAELNPVSWANLSSIHPFSPPDQTKGYSKITKVKLN